MNDSVLEIQKLLRSGQTPEQICEPLGIEVRRKDGKVLFSYDQIESHKFKAHPVVKECRGLILYEDNWDICSMAFSRFLNYGEDGADPLPEDLSGCYVLEKVDGTMVSMYWDRNDKNWHCATRSMIDAEGTVNNLDLGTFAALFWNALSTTKFDDVKGTLKWGRTYVFELTSPYNRVVTYYPETSATLLMVRHNADAMECARGEVEKIAEYLGCAVVKAVKATDFAALLKMQKEDGSQLDPEFEGYVIVKEDVPSHKRNKLKNPAYLALHRVATSVSERNLLELVKMGVHDDFLGRFPEWKPSIDKMVQGLVNMDRIIRLDWQRLCHIEDRKTFAIEACKCRFPSFLFALKNNKVCLYTLKQSIIDMRTDALLDSIEKANK
ncbi:RNA ligase [uncultured archaeon]|nr:RNA ligase [uncultured archaeon]